MRDQVEAGPYRLANPPHCFVKNPFNGLQHVSKSFLTLPFPGICGYRSMTPQEFSMRSALKQTISPSSKKSPPVLSGGSQAIERIPPSKEMRERLRALSADMVASWSCEGLPADVKLHDGLRKKAQELVVRADADVSFV